MGIPWLERLESLHGDAAPARQARDPLADRAIRHHFRGITDAVPRMPA
jgi:hypothetical protein